MPYQVSWQPVSIKSQAPVHVLGVEAAGGGEALLGTGSAAHASAPHAATARIVAAKMPNFVMAAPPASTSTNRDLEKVSCKAQSGPFASLAEIFHPSGRRATG